MGVPMSLHREKSLAKSWVFFALRCHLKTKRLRHLNKRWEIQLIIKNGAFTMEAPQKHMDQQKYLYLRMCFHLCLLFYKWNDLNVTVIFSCVYSVSGFFGVAWPIAGLLRPFIILPTSPVTQNNTPSHLAILLPFPGNALLPASLASSDSSFKS